MKDGIEITVAVPVYNVAPYLQRCIDSLLNQTVLPKEIILLDDGSNDESGRICDENAKKNGLIRVVHKENEGLGFTCNRSIEEARGTHIIFIDSDDWAYPNMIEKLQEAHVKTNADAVVCGYDEVGEQGKILRSYSYEYEEFDKTAIRESFIPRLMGSAPDVHDSICVGAKHVLYSLDVIISNNIRFPSEREVVSEDYYFNLDYYLHAESAVIIPDITYAYVQHDGTITKSYQRNLLERSKSLYFAFKDVLKREELWEKSSERLKKTFFIYLRVCISQELSNKESNKREKFDLICQDEVVKGIICGYPLNSLGLKQQFFLYCVLHKRFFLLNALSRIGVL